MFVLIKGDCSQKVFVNNPPTSSAALNGTFVLFAVHSSFCHLLLLYTFQEEISFNYVFSNFSCRFLNPNNFFQFEF